MIVKPPKRLRKSQIGLFTSNGTVLGEWGRSDISEAPKDAVIYAHSHSSAFSAVREGWGEARYWKKRYVSYRFDGRTVNSCRDVLATLPEEEALDSLREWKRWAEDLGANVGSITGTSRSIWRASLPAKLLIVSGRMPVPMDGIHIGGRQEGEPGIYEYAALWDIRSAYVSTMRDLWIGARYRRYSRHSLRSNGGVGFARATVTLPRGAPFGIIPSHTSAGHMVFPRSGVIEGLFDLQELRAANTLLAKIDIHEAWIARGLRLPWHRWAANIESGYDLPGKASRLVKLMANSLWGTFAVTGRGAWIKYHRGRSVTTLDERETVAPCKPLAAHVSAHMRSRLLMEVLHFSGSDVVAAHTDGVLLHPSRQPTHRIGDGIGEWGVRDIGADVVLLAPTAYSYRREDGKRRYVLAGTPPQFAEKMFRHMVKRYDARNDSKLVGML